MKNKYTFHVHFGDTDAAGIAYYPNYYKWMDQATHAFFKAKNLSISKLQHEKSIIIPLIEANCKFSRPLFYEDVVKIHTELTIERNKILKLIHQFIRGDEKIAKGYEVRMWTTRTADGLKSTIMSDEIKNLLLR